MSAAITGYSSERPAGSIVTSTAGARSSEAPKVSLSCSRRALGASCAPRRAARRRREDREAAHAAAPQRAAQRDRRAAPGRRRPARVAALNCSSAS